MSSDNDSGRSTSHPCTQGKPSSKKWGSASVRFSPLRAGKTPRHSLDPFWARVLTPARRGKPGMEDQEGRTLDSHPCTQGKPGWKEAAIKWLFSPLHAGEILNELPSAYDSLSDQTFVVQFSGSARTSAILSKVVRQGPKDFFPGHSGGVRDDPDPA